MNTMTAARAGVSKAASLSPQKHEPVSTSTRRQPRVPLTLQAVFLASNRGRDVSQPPPQKVAYKTFFGGWTFKAPSSSGVSRKKEIERSDEAAVANNINQKKFGFPLVGGMNKTFSPGPTSHELKQQDDLSSPEGSLANGTTIQALTPFPTSQEAFVSPQCFLDSMLKSRGYSVTKHKTSETAYCNKPTPLQLASYNAHLIKLIRARNAAQVRSIMQSGISPNPCNNHGESLVHLACRRGDYQILKLMLEECGTTVQVSDDYGRTPMHDACWLAVPSFETMDLIMRNDIRLFYMVDSRGATPLSYVRKEHWQLWINFLNSKKDEFWKERNVSVQGDQGPPELALKKANSLPIPDPVNALSLQLASMVASGRMEPEEVLLLRNGRDDDDETETDEEYSSSEEGSLSSDDDYSSNTSDSEDDGSDCTSSSWDESEVDDLIHSLHIPNTVSAKAYTVPS